jgi:aminopeptidase N
MPVTAVICLLVVVPSGAGCDRTPASRSMKPVTVDYAIYSAGRSDPIADPIYPSHGNPMIDVLHYGLDLTWAPQAMTLSGRATLNIRPVLSAGQVTLDFISYTVDSVLVDGVAVSATVADEKLTVRTAVVADRPFTLVVRYHGTPSQTPMPSKRKDRHPLGLTVDGDGGLWTMQEPYGAFTWYPANDQPSDEALYDIVVTVPPSWSAVASGSPAGRDGNTFRYHSSDPVASYLVTLAVGQYTTETAQGPHGLPLTYWIRPAHDVAVLDHLRKSPQYLQWLEDHFGPYPFPTAGAVVVDSLSAMETQQMVTMGAGLIRGTFGGLVFDLDLLHEYAHEWFGDAVTPKTWADMWLNEGWATYAQYLYERETGLGEPFGGDFLYQDDGSARQRYGPPGSPRPSEFGAPNVYVCVAAMLHQIHKALGDAAFFALARDWVQDNRNTQQDRTSFIAFVNAHTGRDFTRLINDWLDSPTTPAH